MSESKPTPGLSNTDFEHLVAIASRAPSVHNTQPWTFRQVDPTTIEIEAAAIRALPHSDPTGRELVISCGAALHNLLMGLRARGLEGHVTALPDPARPLVLATIGIRVGGEPTEADRQAFAAIFRRHTHRLGFEAPADEPELAGALTAEVAAEGAELVWAIGDKLRHQLVDIAHRGNDKERGSRQTAGETAAWSQPIDHDDGVPPWARAPRWDDPRGADRLPDRFASATHTAPGPGGAGALGVLVTDGDGLVDWLTAGRALQRMLLRAAVDWAFASFATPALEHPSLRDEVRDALKTAAYPQMIFELGYSHISISTRRLDPVEVIARGR